MVELLSTRIGPHARHLLAGTGYVLGRFDCPPDDARWSALDWIGPRPHVVLPHTAVRIAAAGADESVVTPVDALLYDGDVHYRRRRIGDDGDRSLFVALDDDLAGELAIGIRRRRPRVRRLPCPPAAFAAVTVAATRACDLLDAASDGGAAGPAAGRRDARARAARTHGAGGHAGTGGADPLALDEWILRALAAIATVADPPVATRTVDEVKALLAADPTHRWTLADLGRAVHYSPFALARMFRAATGQSITAYRRQVRLRQSYPRAVRPGADLARIAVDFGFANHSHYTREFRRVFGHPPAQARRAVTGQSALAGHHDQVLIT